ncbi:hypothetical protein RHMOL_Rhmol11G0018000 [Rhododendron molle]|uniref:Uncharacterized protein n=1 Tax=Rhododendron molle TaxID=49168 RepID=A0ACC0LMX9_RHOML|nr:hypothetical protein RHMOL_Rhmol11G0018000 [Rhododendron molle]
MMATLSSDIADSSSHPPCRCEYPSSDEEAIEELGLLGTLPTFFLHRNRRLEARSGGKKVHKWFLVLPEQVRELVHANGFEAFVLGLNLPKMDWSLVTSLVERWWDTTNTFHLPSASEMTITPGDFSLLTGLRVGGVPLWVDPRLWERTGALKWFLGKVPPLHSRGHIDISWLSKTFMKTDVLTQFLAPLQHLEIVRDFDWGSSALATLYGNLGACSRDKSPILGGLYRVLEVRFDHWGGVPEDAPLARFRVLDRTRSLLEGPFCRAWYLGDQVASQWHPRAEALQFVPPPPPASMRSTSSMSKEDLKNVRIRDWAGLLLQAGDYMEYCRLFLAPAVAAPHVAPVWPRAPSFISFHSDDGEEEHLALTPCTTQLYTLPAGVSQESSFF